MVASGILGCGRERELSTEREVGVAASSSAACTPSVAEKLGVTFVQTCERRDTGGGPTRASFWISTTPMGCSAGEHDTLRCPPVVAVATPRPDGRSIVPGASRLAAVVESETAHKICTMRFAGRLPTREERVRARVELGFASVVVAEASEIGGYRTRELAEWTTDRACDHPTVLDAACGAGRFPWAASPNVPWRNVVACDQRAADALDGRRGRSIMDVNGDCTLAPDARDRADRRELPCLLQISAERPNEGATRVVLTCSPPNAPPRHADLAADVAAFRCVIPEWR